MDMMLRVELEVWRMSKKLMFPILAMSANAFKEDVQHALDAGMNGHIAKPLDTEKMFIKMKEVL